jgi:hypothetical protein
LCASIATVAYPLPRLFHQPDRAARPRRCCLNVTHRWPSRSAGLCFWPHAPAWLFVGVAPGAVLAVCLVCMLRRRKAPSSRDGGTPLLRTPGSREACFIPPTEAYAVLGFGSTFFPSVGPPSLAPPPPSTPTLNPFRSTGPLKRRGAWSGRRGLPVCCANRERGVASRERGGWAADRRLAQCGAVARRLGGCDRRWAARNHWRASGRHVPDGARGFE